MIDILNKSIRPYGYMLNANFSSTMNHYSSLSYLFQVLNARKRGFILYLFSKGLNLSSEYIFFGIEQVYRNASSIWNANPISLKSGENKLS